MAPTPARPDAARPPSGPGGWSPPTSGGSPSRPAARPCPSRSPIATTGPGPDAPQVLVIHALTGSADAAGDWWAPLIGPGRAFDTDTRRRPVREPPRGQLRLDRAGLRPTRRPGRPFGRVVPRRLGPRRGAGAVGLADALGIERFAVVTGGSLGGMIALEVALERPDAVDHVVPIAAPAATGRWRSRGTTSSSSWSIASGTRGSRSHASWP